VMYSLSEYTFVLALGDLSSLCLLSAPWERPRITECRSPEQETFTCRWSAGNYPNLTGPGSLTFFTLKDQEWSECPHYLDAGIGCHLNQSYTSGSGVQCVQLRAHNSTLEQQCFTIQDIGKYATECPQQATICCAPQPTLSQHSG
uniref:Uncharacterized protein n=1 Tax=Callorhinchus milii TaxID=7868 RepID=A0A4W3HZZ3_CALMI